MSIGVSYETNEFSLTFRCLTHKLYGMGKGIPLKVVCSAYIPPAASTIAFGDDTCKVKFEIPPQDREEAKKLVDFQGHELKLTVEVVG